MLSQEQADIDTLKELITQLKSLDEREKQSLSVSIQENVYAYTELLSLFSSLSEKIESHFDRVIPLAYDINNLDNEEECKNPVQKGLHCKTKWSCIVDETVYQSYKNEPNEQTLVYIMYWIYKKQLNGITRLLSHVNKTNILKYDISSRFFAMYCTKKLTVIDSPIIDLSCVRCEHCNSHHFARHLIEWGKELERRIKESDRTFHFSCAYFSNSEWRSILRPVPGHCVENGRRWLPSAKRYDGKFIL